MKKNTLIVLVTLVVGCEMPAMENLSIVNGTEYTVIGKDKVDKCTYRYRLVIGKRLYDYYYKDTANYDVGDTIVLTIKKK